jgi:hypothetical protein
MKIMSTITIRERVTLAVTDPRGWLGWKLGELGNGIARLGNRICDDVPTVDHLGEEFQAGCAFMERAEQRRKASAEVGPTFRTMREASRRTVEEVAERAGVAPAFLRSYEAGESRLPNADTYDALMAALVGLAREGFGQAVAS